MIEFYAISYNLEVVPLGVHEDFSAADECAMKLREASGVLYIARREDLQNLKDNIIKALED